MMTPGRHVLTSADGNLWVHTTCVGAAARLGHDLDLVAERWEANVDVGDTPQTSRLEVIVDLASLVVRGSRGGAKPVSDLDRRQIERNAARALDIASYPRLEFVSTHIEGNWAAAQVTGEMRLHGRTAPATFQVAMSDDQYRLDGSLQQTRFGIKPFSTMMGALRLADTVTVAVELLVAARQAE